MQTHYTFTRRPSFFGLLSLRCPSLTCRWANPCSRVFSRSIPILPYCTPGCSAPERLPLGRYYLCVVTQSDVRTTQATSVVVHRDRDGRRPAEPETASPSGSDSPESLPLLLTATGSPESLHTGMCQPECQCQSPVPVGVGSCEWGPQAQTEIASRVIMQIQACQIFKLKSWRFISAQLEIVSAAVKLWTVHN